MVARNQENINKITNLLLHNVNTDNKKAYFQAFNW